MSVDTKLNPYTVSVPDASHYPVARSSVKELSTQQPKVTDKEDERHKRIVDKTSYLWAGFEGNAYDEVVDAIVNQWTESGPPDKKFLEKAVDLLVDFQNRPMKNMKDSLEWSERLKESGIDSKRYLAWVDEQYERLAREKHKGFDDITLKKFSLSLTLADWKDANDDSAIVNAYLLKAEPSLKPEIYLGRLGKSRLAVRVNGKCLRPQKTDFHTADSHGVTAINPDILLEMRYVPLKSGESRETMLFIPIGESMGPLPLTNSRYMLTNWVRECLLYGTPARPPNRKNFRGREMAGHWNCPSAKDFEEGGNAARTVHG
jgi:hypothetical protein